jgi:large subunit ribosomal protein L24
MAAKIKKGDKVVLLTGKRSDKGKQGSVLKVYPEKNRVLVEGINIVQRHTKPTQANPQGGIVNKEAPVHVSNVAIVDPKTGEPTRVGFRMEGDRKVRFAKKSGEALNG